MNAYFETSALVKLFVREPGSDAADAVWDASDVIVTSRITYAEARAALAAAARAGRLTSTALRTAKTGLDVRFGDIAVVEVTDQVVRSAGDLAERYALRGYHAVHLGSGLSIGGDVTVATWDRALAAAARHAGLGVAGARL